MSGVGGGGVGDRDGGVNRLAGGDSDDEILRRGEGGYNRVPVTGAAGRGTEDVGEVRRMVQAMEQRIRQLEEELKATKKDLDKKSKGNEGSKYELVNMKEMTP